LFRPPRDRRRQHTGERQRRQRVFVDSSQFFLLCAGFAETRCFCCRGLPTSVLTRPRGTNARGAGTGSGGRSQPAEGRRRRRTTDSAKFTGEKDQGGFGSAVAPDSLPSSSKIMDSVMSNFSRTNREVHAHSEERDESNPRQPVKHIRQAPRRVAKQIGIPREGDGTYSRHHEQPGSDCGRTGGDDCTVVQLVLQRVLCEPPRRLCGAAHKPAHSSPCIDEVGFVRPDGPEVQPE